MRDKLTIGIGLYTRALPALPPLVSMYRFPTICSEAVCPHAAYQIVVGGQRGSACVVRFRPEQIYAVTDSVSEQQWSVRLISSKILKVVT